jgi:NodT family efflux transporter outer membrane factor (OMF) lipoprotein
MSRPILLASVWALPAALVLGACTVGPDYQRPVVTTPLAYASAASGDTQTPAAGAELASWWRQFNDPKLSELIERGLAGSLTLQSDVSRIRAARQKEIEVGAAAYPSISTSGSELKLHTETGSALSALGVPTHVTSFAAGFDATWEIDLFGATRRAVEAASATTEAQLWSRRDGEVSLTAEIARDYLSLRAFQARIALGNAELLRQQDLFALIAARRRAGFVTDLDVNQQSTLVATAAAQIPQLGAEAHAEIHALGALLGEPPEALESELDAPGAIPTADVPSLPLGLPAELLLRRPDIREAERRLAAATAGIGVKAASLYPKLNLYGLATFAGMSVSDLFSHQNLLLAGLGMVSAPVFDAGRNHAEVREAEEERVQAELAYRFVIVGALRDVEDAVVRLDAEQTRRQSLGRAVDAARSSLVIAQDQYRTGFVTFVNVLEAQYALLGAEDQLTLSQALVLTDVVAAYKALGGGWSP